jgi:3-oxoacyl-[acyl-carrier-protein] synthase III
MTMTCPSKSIIESIGVYLPPEAVTTEEVLKGCQNEIRFPLEQLTGIRSRRMAGKGEYSIDLARNAIAECLDKSRRSADEIDLLMCTNISRYDGPCRCSFEPSAAVALKKYFGFDRSLAMDINNACAGMFTGILVVDALIRTGLIRCGIVASGEYITHLTQTAQREITSYVDPRLACLTVGDAGAAVLLTASPTEEVGFHTVDMYTLSKYSPLCVAKPTEQAHGGAVMSVDSISATAIVVERSAMHAAGALLRTQTSLDSLQHIIPHQTSKTTCSEAVSEIARLFDQDLGHRLIENLAERGNTASNTHFVALNDHIRSRRIRAGDVVMFCISGSGMTVGTALYTMDDLPQRLCQGSIGKREKHVPDPQTAESSSFYFRAETPRVRLESVGTALAESSSAVVDTIELARRAAEDCLAGSSFDRSEIELLLSVGQYRSEFVAEPAAATLTACHLKMNDDSEPQDERRTLAFDVLNGATGFLNACCLASGLIRAKSYRQIMVVASETDHIQDASADKRLGVAAAGSAVILNRSTDPHSGFGGFLFRDYTEHIDSLSSSVHLEPGRVRVTVDRSPDLEDRYLECICDAVVELLEREGLDKAEVKVVFPPQISPTFVSRLSEVLGLQEAKFVDVAEEDGDLFTSSTPFALKRVHRQAMVSPGDVGLIINVGAGIAVGCAVYHF